MANKEVIEMINGIYLLVVVVFLLEDVNGLME